MKIFLFLKTYGIISFVFFSSCKIRSFSEAKLNSEQSFSFEKYAQMCSQVLGDAPSFDCLETNLSSSKVILPRIGKFEASHSLGDIRLSSSEAYPENFKIEQENETKTNKSDIFESAPYGKELKAINDSWLITQINGMWPELTSKYILEKWEKKSPIGQPVTWVSLCRVSLDSSPSFLKGQVGLIGYNNITGDTCFFNASRISNKVFPSANSVQGSNPYDDFKAIQASGNCTNCHDTSPFINSAIVMPKTIYQAFKKANYQSETNSAEVIKFLTQPLMKSLDFRLVPSSLIQADEQIKKQIPYKIVAQRELRNSIFQVSKASWRVARVVQSHEKLAYCQNCHLNTPPPVSPFINDRMNLMFGRKHNSLIPNKVGSNWHDILFKTKLSEEKINKYFSMNTEEIQSTWVYE
jgi:hypothetical protein